MLLADYMAAWRRHDIAAVLETLADGCVVIECYGPVYRGKDRVAEWMNAWFAAGGKVLDWQVTSSASAGGMEVAEWEFRCVWKDQESGFSGTTVARVVADHITYLREYATTAPLYDWTGQWRD